MRENGDRPGISQAGHPREFRVRVVSPTVGFSFDTVPPWAAFELRTRGTMGVKMRMSAGGKVAVRLTRASADGWSGSDKPWLAAGRRGDSRS